MRKLKNRNIFLLLTIILSLGITLGAVYFMYQYRDSRENSLSTGLISLKFTDQSNTVNLSSNVPMIDDLGLKNTPYEFTIENTSKVPINVDIKVDVDNNTSIHLGAVRYGLYIDDKLVKKDYIHNDLILYTYEELLRDESINCKIKFWVDYYYDRPDQTFIGKIKAEGSSRDKLYNGVTVTFDPNGGVVDINSKEVGIGETYGKLPTPVRDGYTFMGWNGKNIIDVKQSINENLRNNSAIQAHGTNVFDNNWVVNNIKASTNYFISYDVECVDVPEYDTKNVSGYGFIRIHCYGDTYSSRVLGESEYLNIGDKVHRELTFITAENVNKQSSDCRIMMYTNRYLKNNQQVLGTMIFSNIQIIEGTEPTEYEPYYITSKTKVVQKGNHTLKAIWKKNS